MPSDTRAAEGPVKQHDSAQRGRHLRASDHVSAGKRILQEEAVAAVLYDDQVANRCHMSFKIIQSPLRCGGCKFARYASRDNQRLAWQQGHREECPALQACNPNKPPPTVRLVARLCWRRDRYVARATRNACNLYKPWCSCKIPLSLSLSAGSEPKNRHALTTTTWTAWSIIGATCQTARSSCMLKWLL